ncbi:hypothetical protein MHH49_15275 [Paenibacillus sp. FSL F4-0122]|uniref:hypothetical protein n=1 Tax=Paenibacillus sp. FSL F4-0122 TaxID=2921371 RepID=UPI0030F72F7F
MEDRLVIRISVEEKEDLALIAKDLGLSLSSLARRRLLGDDLKEMYFQLIKDRIDQLQPGKEFTLKKILPVHWSYLSKSDREYLVTSIEDEADDEELQIEVVERKKRGKCKFKKIEDDDDDLDFSIFSYVKTKNDGRDDE